MTLSLQELFDLQHFEENPRLQTLIDDTLKRYGMSDRVSLAEHDLSQLYAAGNPYSSAASPAAQDATPASPAASADLFPQKESL